MARRPLLPGLLARAAAAAALAAVAALAALSAGAAGAAAGPLLVAVVPDVEGPGPGDEGVAVAAEAGADLSGFRLTDGEGSWTFPAGSVVAAGEEAWVVGNASRWQEMQGPAPRWVWQGSVPLLANDGDEVRLLDPAGRLVDAVAWGDGATEGQSGSVAHASPGLVLRRLRDGAGWRDTDDADDWRTPRLHRLGETAWAPTTFDVDRVTLYASPDSSFDVLSDLVAGAERRLHLHVYDLRHGALVDALVAARAAHPALDLQVLVEDRPVGQDEADRHETAWALSSVADAGGRAWVAGSERFAHHHLKVLVADDAVAIQSENWVASGVPQDPSWGNRGWGVVLHDPDLADHVAARLAEDRAAWDTVAFDRSAYDPGYVPPPRFPPRSGDHGPPVPPRVVEGPVPVTVLFSPDATHDPAADPVAALVRSAERRVLAQQLDLSTRSRNPLGWSGDDALLDGLVAAADAGADVRVLVAAPFGPDDAGNAAALEELERRAPSSQGRVFSRGDLVLHNKGLVVDDAVVVGSMNGNHFSRSSNREAVAIVASPAAADHFAALFEDDWDAAPPGRDWGAVADDLEAMPWPAWPTLFALLAVARLRWR